MSATEVTSAGFDSVPNNSAATMFAFRCKGVNGAFKTVEVVRDSSDHHFNGLVVFVSTHFTTIHKSSKLKFFFSLFTFLRRTKHLLLFGIFETFFNELFGESLFVSRRNC